VVRVAAVLALVTAIALWSQFAPSLPAVDSEWGNVAILSFGVIPAMFGLVWLCLPLRGVLSLPQLAILAATLVVLAVACSLADLEIAANLLKLAAATAVGWLALAFFGRAGQAVLRSIQKLRVDPMAVYGTNCVKYEGEEDAEAHEFLRRELHVVQPKLVVAMGQDAVACLNAAQFPLATTIEETTPGELQKLTPTIEVLVTPDVDASLDEAPAKRAFWNAFKAIGPWWSELPPY